MPLIGLIYLLAWGESRAIARDNQQVVPTFSKNSNEVVGIPTSIIQNRENVGRGSKPLVGLIKR